MRKAVETDDPDVAASAAKALHKALESEGPDSPRGVEGVERVAPALEALVCALREKGSNHRINKLAGGNLVPTLADIDRVNVQEPRPRRNP